MLIKKLCIKKKIVRKNEKDERVVEKKTRTVTDSMRSTNKKRQPYKPIARILD